MTHAVATIPLALISGKDFGHSWEIALAATGPAESLAGIGAVEFRMSRQGVPVADPIIWSIASGHITIVADEMVLFVAGSQTEDIPAGSWTWLFSYGAVEAETPLVQGRLLATEEP